VADILPDRIHNGLTTVQASPERNTKSLVLKKRPDRICILYQMLPDPRSMLLKIPTTAPYLKPTFDERQKMKRTQLTSVSESQEYGPRALVVHTDGACPNNGKHGARAGIGVWYGPDDPR
jgi:hypothetical protein